MRANDYQGNSDNESDKHGDNLTMFAKGSQLAQINPSASASTAYTSTLRTELTRIVVCNTTVNTVGFSIYHDDDGTTYAAGTALYSDQSISGNTSFSIGFDGFGGGIHMARGASIGVKSSVDQALTFSIYGVTEDVAK